ncbi:Uncharacterised protein [Mycobacteroides abscessus subsp. abscessus]|nr:Uncharacterised protein [Mycobacteroides abscessus subsp. abscessus]
MNTGVEPVEVVDLFRRSYQPTMFRHGHSVPHPYKAHRARRPPVRIRSLKVDGYVIKHFVAGSACTSCANP